MEKSLFALAIAASGAGTSFAADGLITFAYFGDGDVHSTIHYAGGQPVNNSYFVGLFAGDQSSNDAAAPIATTTVFGAGTAQDPATGLFQFNGPDVAIPGSTPGQSTTLTIKAWTGAATFAAANFLTRAVATFATQPLGGVNKSPPPPAFFAPDLSGPTPTIGFKGLVVDLPESSTYALLITGLGSLAMIRRRK